MSDHLNPEMRPDPLSSLFSAGLFGRGGRAWGLGFGLGGFVATDPALSGIPMSVGTYSWGGAATTHFWVDREQELVGIVMTQLLPDGTYPVRQMMQSMTYQASSTRTRTHAVSMCRSRAILAIDLLCGTQYCAPHG